MKALEKTYVINAKTSVEVASLWNFLSKIRALLPVQMSPEEEELVRKLLSCSDKSKLVMELLW